MATAIAGGENAEARFEISYLLSEVRLCQNTRKEVERDMFRLDLVIAALLPIVGAQTLATDPTPLEVTGYISPIA
jgi:hypothetical protein